MVVLQAVADNSIVRSGRRTPIRAKQADSGAFPKRLRRGHPGISLGQLNAVIGILIVIMGLVWIGDSVGEALSNRRTVRTLNVKVESGDTLWSIANRYGDPDQYILRRVQKLAEENHIQPGARLQAGTELRVRVENPGFRGEMMTASAR